MEAPPPRSILTAPLSRKLLLLLPVLLLLLPAEAQKGWEAEDSSRAREKACHFYAGGQVYPGEASLLSVADHSVHLSKAKSRWCPIKGKWVVEGCARGKREMGRDGRHVDPGLGGSGWGGGLA